MPARSAHDVVEGIHRTCCLRAHPGDDAGVPLRRSGGLGHAAGITTGIVGRRFDRRGRERLGCVGQQLGRIVRHRLLRVDLRTRPRQGGIHVPSEPVRRTERVIWTAGEAVSVARRTG